MNTALTISSYALVLSFGMLLGVLLILAISKGYAKHQVLQEVYAERKRQDKKWGVQNWPIATLDQMYRMTETVSLYKARCDERAKEGVLTWYDIVIEEFAEAFSEESPTMQRRELIHLAATAVSAAEYLDRREEFRRG